jgi:hypothetical protein
MRWTEQKRNGLDGFEFAGNRRVTVLLVEDYGRILVHGRIRRKRPYRECIDSD